LEKLGIGRASAVWAEAAEDDVLSVKDGSGGDGELHGSRMLDVPDHTTGIAVEMSVVLEVRAVSGRGTI
jgi:hypothetical protein